MGRVKRIWYLSSMRAAKVQASLRKRNPQTESQIPSPSEWLGMRSYNLSWRNARRRKFAWHGPYDNHCDPGSLSPLWVKRNPQTESQIPSPSEWLGMRSYNLSWRNARRRKFAWHGPYDNHCDPGSLSPGKHPLWRTNSNFIKALQRFSIFIAWFSVKHFAYILHDNTRLNLSKCSFKRYQN